MRREAREIAARHGKVSGDALRAVDDSLIGQWLRRIGWMVTG